ncbi:zinc finger homeobox protein 3-like [Stegostoma tigrinum]|uniref:zinc finger homeobox protein 3-like n=1 Tax=Stegostoma tigrinum TaxID=3053191 RepID=UPI0028706535|nr:zinc finger homeobox protein 3-like [Stegostoma tigrinum]
MDSRNPLAPQPEGSGGQTSHCEPPLRDPAPPGGGGAAPTVDQLLGNEAKGGAKGGGCVPLMPSPSPNGGKILKCPQCNWHYKYSRTRDAHMRQKHPGVGTAACTHCQEGGPHPRLARGQNYSCGYRPFTCRVCEYATMTKGNLGIHMQSERHLANVQGRGVAEGQAPGIALGLRTVPSAGLELHRQCRDAQGAGRRVDAGTLHDGLSPRTGTGGHGGSGGTDSSEDLVTDERCLGRGTELDEGTVASHEPSAQLFQCLACQAFRMESLAPPRRHLSAQCRPPEEEWKGLDAERPHCTLCPYRTQLKANFQLHLGAETHSQDCQPDAHPASTGYPLRPDSLNALNPLHVRCNLCCFSTTSREQLYLHISGPSHRENLRLYTHLQQLDHDATTERPRYTCMLCGFETTTKLSLMDHARTESHQDTRAQLQLRNAQQQDGNSFLSFIGLTEAPQRPGDAKAEERGKAPDTGTNGQKPAEVVERAHLHCPLCQEVLSGHLLLRLHLIHTHSVASDCMARLLAVAHPENHSLGASPHTCAVSADPPPGTGSESKADTGLTSPNILGIAAPDVPPMQLPLPGMMPPWQDCQVPGDTENRQSGPLRDVDSETRAEAKTSVLQPPCAPGTQLVPCLLPGTNPLLVHPLPAAYLLPLRGQKAALLPLGPLLSPTLLCLLPNVILQRGLQGVAQRQPRPRCPGPQGDPGHSGEGPSPVLAAPCSPLRACGAPLPGYQAPAVRMLPLPLSATKDVPHGIPQPRGPPSTPTPDAGKPWGPAP